MTLVALVALVCLALSSGCDKQEPAGATNGATGAATGGATGAATGAATNAATNGATGAATNAATADEASGQDAMPTLEHEMYTLDNGLRVILHQDMSLPLATINLWYQVGSRDEPKGRTGFAHLFEHLMFMGTERVPSFDIIMESGGGSNNATTGTDRTNYFATGPANQLDTLLWLEADRLEGLDEAMTQEKLDLQREVVRNERRQRYENAPYGEAWLKIHEVMYPEGHPYHHTPIGSHEDLQAATVEDVVNFFRTYYVPANLVLVVAGRFEVEAVKASIEAYFGDLPAGEKAAATEAPAAPEVGVERLTLTDDVQLPRLYMAWHSPAFYAEGDATADVLASVLTNGKNSRLYKALVYDQQVASDVSAFQASQGLGSLFIIQATAQPGHTLEELEAVIDAELAKLREAAPSEREVTRARNQIETFFVRRLESIAERADLLNQYLFYTGSPDNLAADLQRYRDVTAAAVQGLTKEVLDPEHRLILKIVPESGDAATNPEDNQ